MEIENMLLPAGVRKSIIMNSILGIDSESNKVYLELYLSCLQRASSLLNEAILLFEAGYYPTSYFLGMSALEEISKSQMAADVFTGYITKDDFKESYRYHIKKLERVEWIKIDGNSFPEFFYGSLTIKDFYFKKKLEAMYVDIDFNLKQVSHPADKVEKSDAESVIKAVKVGLHRIYEVTEQNGEQIGTKGFMK